MNIAKINSPLRLTRNDELEKVADTSDRNFISAWNIFNNILIEIKNFRNKKYLEVVDIKNGSITVKIGNTVRTINT